MILYQIHPLKQHFVPQQIPSGTEAGRAPSVPKRPQKDPRMRREKRHILVSPPKRRRREVEAPPAANASWSMHLSIQAAPALPFAGAQHDQGIQVRIGGAQINSSCLWMGSHPLPRGKGWATSFPNKLWHQTHPTSNAISIKPQVLWNAENCTKSKLW